jgi:hypothetical protein
MRIPLKECCKVNEKTITECFVLFLGEISSFDEDNGGQSSLSQEDKLLLSRLLLLLNPAYPASYDGKSAATATTSR